jgi:hypothetical protein
MGLATVGRGISEGGVEGFRFSRVVGHAQRRRHALRTRAAPQVERDR